MDAEGEVDRVRDLLTTRTRSGSSGTGEGVGCFVRGRRDCARQSGPDAVSLRLDWICASASRTSPTTRSTSTCRLPGAMCMRAIASTCRNARIGADHRTSASTASRTWRVSRDRRRPQGRTAAAARAPHVDGFAHPPLQDRDRGLPGAARRGLHGDRVAARRARMLLLLRGGPSPGA